MRDPESTAHHRISQSKQLLHELDAAIGRLPGLFIGHSARMVLRALRAHHQQFASDAGALQTQRDLVIV